jgi:hypothetical protein
VAPLISFKRHGQLETPLVPAIVLAPWLAGELKEPRARAFFLGFFGVAFAHYVLTDYDANERGGRQRSAPAELSEATQGDADSLFENEQASVGPGEGDAGKSDGRVFQL